MPTRSWSDASRAYRYGFVKQEKDNDIGEDYSFDFRELNVRICRFMSVDPLVLRYPSWSPFVYAMNRPIDGIDIEGKEWCTQHKWGDVITDEEDIKLLGDNYTEGMTYEDAYRILAPQLAAKRLTGDEKYDCADFTIDVMVEFAYMFKLPVHFEDDKPEHSKGGISDPTFDNENFGYYDRDGVFQAIQEGDWKALSKAIQKDYTSYDIWVNDNKFTTDITKTFKKDMKPGDMISVQWTKWEPGKPAPHYHAQLIVEIKKKDGTYIIIQGNTDENQKPMKPEKRVNKIWGIIKKIITGSDGKDKDPAYSLKVKQWNFKYFDNYIQ